MPLRPPLSGSLNTIRTWEGGIGRTAPGEGLRRDKDGMGEGGAGSNEGSEHKRSRNRPGAAWHGLESHWCRKSS